MKLVLAALIAAGTMALLGYAAIGGWPYDEVNEVTFHPGVETVLAALIGPSGLFFMGTVSSIFLLALLGQAISGFGTQVTQLALPLTAALLLGALTYTATFALRWRRVRRMFGVTQSEGVARALESDPRRLDPGGEEREVVASIARKFKELKVDAAISGMGA